MSENWFAGRTSVESYNQPSSIAAMVAMCQPGGITLSSTPVLLTLFVRSGSFTTAQAASLGSAELAGMTLGIIAIALVVGKIDRRRWALGSILLAVAGHLVTACLARRGMFLPTLLARALAGLGEGCVTGIGVAALGGLRVPDGGFGWAVTGNLLGSAAMFALMPYFQSSQGFTSALETIVAYSLGCALFLPLLPHRVPVVVQVPAGASQHAVGPRRPAAIGLVGMLVFLGGLGVVWPITPQIGVAQHIDSVEVTRALSLAGIAGAAAGILVGWLGTRIGRAVPILVGACGVTISMVTLNWPGHPTAFSVSAITIMTFWIFSVPYYFGALAMMDVTGRVVTMSMAMQTLGLASGQALAAWILTSTSSFTSVIGTGMTLVILGAGAVVFAMHLFRRAVKDAKRVPQVEQAGL